MDRHFHDYHYGRVIGLIRLKRRLLNGDIRAVIEHTIEGIKGERASALFRSLLFSFFI